MPISFPLQKAENTAPITLPRKPLSSRYSTPVIVVPPGEQTWSFSSAECNKENKEPTRVLVRGNHHLRSAADRVGGQVQREVARQAGLDAAVGQRLDQHVDEGGTASRQSNHGYASRTKQRGTIHVVLGDLEHLTQIAEHFLHQDVRVLIRIRAQRVAANALQNAAGRVRKETHNSASVRADLTVKSGNGVHLVADLLDGDAAGDRNEELGGGKRLRVAQGLF